MAKGLAMIQVLPILACAVLFGVLMIGVDNVMLLVIYFLLS